MTTMSAAEAEGFGISEDDRLSYVRLDDANATWQGRESAMVPTPPHQARQHRPPNRTATASAPSCHGSRPTDEIAAAPNHDLNTALDAIKAGPEPGVLYTATKRGQSSDRWCGNVLCQMFDTQRNRQPRWSANGSDLARSSSIEYLHPKAP